jgi:hypothetical protein
MRPALMLKVVKAPPSRRPLDARRDAMQAG